MWIVEEEAEADVASDLSAFHRIDDVSTIDGPRYFSLAQRLSAYQGVRGAVLAERAARERQEGGGSGSSAPRGGVTRVSEAEAVIAADGWIEHVKEEG